MKTRLNRHFLILSALAVLVTTSHGQSLESIGDFFPTDISGNGSIVVGRSTALGSPPVRWENGALDYSDQGQRISTDGLVTVGVKGDHGYRWANGAGQVISPPWDPIESGAFGTNADGSVVVGFARLPQGTSLRLVGFIWRSGSFERIDVEQHTSVSASNADGTVFGGSTGPFLHELRRAVV